MKKVLGLCLALAAALALTVPAAAAREEDYSGTTVYVAGNPDMYPLEYYDENGECYRGILPALYRDISRETGLRFEYLREGSPNQQEHLAENLQVDLVSVHYEDEVSAAPDKLHLFRMDEEEGGQWVCIAFTEIADPGVAGILRREIAGMTRSDLLRYSLELDRGGASGHIWLYMSIGLSILLVLIVLLASSVRQNRKKHAEELHNRMTDPLTGIGNAEYFQYCYEHFIPAEARELYYISYISLNFKRLSRFFGTSEVEEIQRSVANVLVSTIRDGDFAARLDDGVFVTAFLAENDEKARITVSEQVNRLNSFENERMSECGLSYRAGVYQLNKSRETAETVVFNARQGYRYAERDDSPVCFCDADVLKNEARHSRLQQKLITAVNNEEFRIYMQFVVDRRSSRICGAEVLTRWHNLEEGVVSPGLYIDELREAGLNDRLDFWVLDQVCRILEGWKDTPYGFLHLSCNFSRQTFSQESFLDRLRETLEKYSFDRSRLVLELTEDALQENTEVAFRNAQGSKDLGCRISLDDFGSGYTSFCDLCDYPIDIIKLDRTIMAKTFNPRGEVLLRGMSRLAHDLGVTVLCEGVETREEAELSGRVDCDLIQGFYYSHVLPLDEALSYYEKYTADLQK